MGSFQESTHSTPRIASWLFLGFSCLYVSIGGGHIDSPDGVVMFRVSESLLERAATDIQPLENWSSFGGSLYRDGPDSKPRFYAKYGLGQSLASLPTLFLGRVLAGAATPSERGVFDTPIGLQGPADAEHPLGRGNPLRLRWDDWTQQAWPRPFVSWAASWTNAWVTAAALAVLFLLGCELGFGIRPSLAMALVAGLATPLLHYATTFFSEPLAGLALVSFLLLLVRAARRERGSGFLMAAGAALGLCVLVKIAHAVLLLPALLLAVELMRRRERWFSAPRKAAERVRALASFGAGVAIPLAVIALYNHARFGDIFETGYAAEVAQWTTPFLEGFAGLLVSPGRGLFWFAPITLAALALAPRFGRRFPREAAFVGISLLLLLATYARWYMWEGGWCWGPRFLIPLLPLLMLPLGAVLAERPRSSLVRVALGVAIVSSAVVAWSGVWVNTIDFHNWVKLSHAFRAEEFSAAGAANYYDLVRWDWRFSPLVAYWSFPVKDAFLLPHALATPGLVLAVLAACAVGAGVSAWQVVRLVRVEGLSAALGELSGNEASVAP